LQKTERENFSLFLSTNTMFSVFLEILIENKYRKTILGGDSIGD
jgi:hypothetical protein